MKSLLSLPFAYQTFRRIVAGQGLNRTFVAQHVKPANDSRILDIGCGPASILEFLPPSSTYVGFDPSDAYVTAARERYGSRGSFHQGIATLERLASLGQFDLVLSIGVLHHLDDQQAQELCQVASRSLRPGGRLVTLDGCFEDGQSPIARFILSKDRGRFVREMPEYRRLAQTHFAKVETRLRDDLLRIPYTHLIMECTKSP